MKDVLIAIAKYFYGLLSAIYLFTIGFIVSGRARGLISTICAHFGFRTSEAIIPKVPLSEILNGVDPIQISELAEHDGNITLQELAVIVKLVQQHQPKTIFEIGTFDGRTTLNMALNSGPEAKIYTLDLSREQLNSTKLHISSGDKIFVDKPASGTRFQHREEARRITQLYGDSASFDFAPYFNTMDFIFLDGSHAYDYVRNDTEIALKLLRDGHGLILWHDYTAWKGVTSALNKLYLSHNKFKTLRHMEGTTLVFLTL